MNITQSSDLFGAITPPSSNPLIGLAVTLPTPCRCGGMTAVIGSSRAMHAAALTCTACGRFTRWMPETALTFIAQTVQHFGPPRGPVALRDIITIGDDLMDEQRKVNSGVLFKNNNKVGKQPDYRGYLNAAGIDYEVAGWISQTEKAGRFISFKLTVKEEKAATAPKPAQTKELDDEIGF
jgi:hypothetical protein